MSSLVGPRPPVVMTMSHCDNDVSSASMIRSRSSPIDSRSVTTTPTELSAREM